MPTVRRRVRASRAPAEGRSRSKRRAVGGLLVAIGVFLGVAFVPDPGGRENLVGPLGQAAFGILTLLFSWGGLVAAVLLVVWGVVLFRGRGAEGASRFSALAGVGALACLTAFALLSDAGGGVPGQPARMGGMLALELAQKLRGSLGLVGALLAVGLGVLVTVVLVTDGRPAPESGRLARARAVGERIGRALLWTAGVVAAALASLAGWIWGLIGVLGVAAGAARSRLRARAADPGDVAGRAPGAGVPGGLVARSDAEGRSPGVDLRPGSGAAGPPAGGGARAGAGTAASLATGPNAADAGPYSRARSVPTARASGARAAATTRAGAAGRWEVPLELFDAPASKDAAASERELHEQGRVLIRKLADFNVRGEVVGISSGPVITQFEVEPAPGVKVNQIANLADDLALAMRAQRIRIVAPIPGRGAVGIEIPNARPERVTIRELLAAPAFRDSRGTLPIALGKEISGTPVVADLTRMPHLLIAGSTGSGKSVCINALLTSLLVRFPPEDLRLVLVDPKMLELSMYNDVPHLLHPVVTRPREAAVALKWAVYEMDRRFELLARNTVRNIADFNARLREGAELAGVDSPLSSADEAPRPLPYVVVIVDELADLMLTVQAEIEEPLARLAQKARAVGLHVVLATQRPSVNVLTGFIKANFPSRISFQVASKTDSRTVLDQNGAEALLGTGDMLFLPADRAAPVRIQGAFVSSRETEALVRTLQELAGAHPAALEDRIDLEQVEGAELEEGEAGERDELFFEAARVVIEHDQGSTSLLQRRLKIGYSRAARIVDQLQQHGIVGPGEGSKPREVRIGLDELADMQAVLRSAGTRSAARSTSSA